jgi:hypothetical protein
MGDGDCCNNTCTGGNCCYPDNQACSSSNDCCNDNCNMGMGGSMLCCYSDGHGPCTTATDCCNMDCNEVDGGGSICCQTSGNACTEDGQCCSGTCAADGGGMTCQ